MSEYSPDFTSLDEPSLQHTALCWSETSPLLLQVTTRPACYVDEMFLAFTGHMTRRSVEETEIIRSIIGEFETSNLTRKKNIRL